MQLDPVFDNWICRCPNLQFFEIAMSRPAAADPDAFDTQTFWLPYDQRHGFIHNPPEKLTELRLLPDTSFRIDLHLLVIGLAEFRNLKKLALAHVMMWDLS